ELHAPVNVGREDTTSGWLEIPPQAVRDGRVQLRIVKTGGAGQASVAELWLREANYDGASAPIFENEFAQIPQAFALEQNYPNPFNPQTTIAFSVPENFHGQVSLRIYDMTGKLVRELINEDRGPGRYRVVWDGLSQSGNRLASGLYLYQLRAGSFSTARKLILMK
ncbi:T9SS type A sorting domain-containing protein, partial [Cytophagia bacterium CHB2]|nr:T9SS type A sorting domain-containing protein [Cytophagia bacterium CHB2]